MRPFLTRTPGGSDAEDLALCKKLFRQFVGLGATIPVTVTVPCGEATETVSRLLSPANTEKPDFLLDSS